MESVALRRAFARRLRRSEGFYACMRIIILFYLLHDDVCATTYTHTHTCTYIHIDCIAMWHYGVATISRLLKMIGLFCRISSLLKVATISRLLKIIGRFCKRAL